MERNEALKLLAELEGRNLHELAAHYEVTVQRDGRQNKGWAGHVCERHLGLPINSAQSPNFGSWELKSFPVKSKGNRIVAKETMAITMIDPYNVLATPFENSHLLSKLRKAVIVVRNVGTHFLEPSHIHAILPMDLSEEDMEVVRQDYEDVRSTIRDYGFNALTGKMGRYVQPRTKGPGHGSISRAFYARTGFLNVLLEKAGKDRA